MSEQTHDQKIRELLLERYGNLDRTSFRHKTRYLLKRVGWVAVVKGAYVLKRLFDIIASPLQTFTVWWPLTIRSSSPLTTTTQP